LGGNLRILFNFVYILNFLEMKFNWHRWNKAIHRDLGYVFFAMTIIYAISGIAINHLKDWNPNYVITNKGVKVEIPSDYRQISKEDILQILADLGEKGNYKKHYYPGNEELKVFIDGGTLVINLETGSGQLEKIRRRPVLHAMNYLHYNPGKWWTLFSDIYGVALVLIAVTGLFVLKGKNGISRRGAILTIVGIIIPLVFLLIFY
jgi:hypothetical protein